MASTSSQPAMWQNLPELVQNINFKDPEGNDKGGTSVYATHGDPPKLLKIQMNNLPNTKKGEIADCYLPFGISRPYKKVPKGTKVPRAPLSADPSTRKTLDVAIANPAIVEKIRAFERACMQKLAAESARFFGKKLSVETIEKKFVSSIKEDENEEDDGKKEGENKSYAPRLRMKFMTTGPFTVKVQLMDGGEKRVAGRWEDLDQPRARVVVIARYGGLWFASGDWGHSWEAQQVLVYPPSSDDDMEFVNTDEDAALPPLTTVLANAAQATAKKQEQQQQPTIDPPKAPEAVGSYEFKMSDE